LGSGEKKKKKEKKQKKRGGKRGKIDVSHWFSSFFFHFFIWALLRFQGSSLILLFLSSPPSPSSLLLSHFQTMTHLFSPLTPDSLLHHLLDPSRLSAEYWPVEGILDIP
jgi:hypothetical protein